MLNHVNAPRSFDKSITAFSLANVLGIHQDDLPCIVITSNFCLKEFSWLRTSPDQLEQQLTELGFMAERGLTDWDRLASRYGHGVESLPINLARALSDSLCFMVASSTSDSWLKSKALKQARNTIESLYGSINQVRRSLDDDLSEEFDRLCICILSFLAQLNTEPSAVNSFIKIPKEFLENESFLILQTAQKVFDMLIEQRLRKLFPGFTDDGIDYTPGIICLAKLFEKEANLSVVHWVRKELVVSLPMYFNKHEPGVKARVTPGFGGQPIDLNKVGRHGKWLPPGIGQSELACREIVKRGLPARLSKESWDLLATLWRQIREKRNEAAHTELMSRASLLCVKDALQQLSEGGLFETFYQMKLEYRGSA